MPFSQADYDLDQAFFHVRYLLLDKKLDDLHMSVAQIHADWRRSVGANEYNIQLTSLIFEDEKERAYDDCTSV